MDGKEELYRRLEQSRRLVAEPLDPTTQERIRVLIKLLEEQLAAIEARDTDAPRNDPSLDSRLDPVSISSEKGRK